MRRIFPLFAMASLAFMAAPTAALAHPKLESSSPAANGTVSKPTVIKLTFNEVLLPQFSTFELVMTGMPGMAKHEPMKISGFKTVLTKSGKVIETTLPRALPTGQYELTWHVVAADTHRTEGKFTFSVK